MLGALRTRRLLIVLDNCEHVIDACAKLETLLRSCSEVHILATSREPLGIRAESVCRVPSLSLPPDGSVSAETAGDFGAVKLFIERAHNHDQSLHLDEDTTLAVVSVCRQVDGIPLAIELAAARLRTMSVHTLENRLSDRLRLLTGGSRTNLPRQQTLRALIDWSYDLLTEPERTVLRRLSVFSDGFEAEVAETVCARDDLDAFDIFDIIASLVDKSLVQRDPSVTSTRYRLLETVRQYASELLRPDDARATRDAHADAYLAIAELAADHLQGPEQFEWLVRLDAEHENLRAAFGHFHADDDHATDALRLSAALWRYWLIRGEYREGTEMLEAALDHKDAQSPTYARASALIASPSLQGSVANWDREAARGQEAISLARSLGHPDLVYALHHLAELKFREGDIPGALLTVDEAVGVAQAADSSTLLARALNKRGVVHGFAGQAERALADLNESVRIYSAAGDKIMTMTSLNDLAYHELEVDLDDAEKHALDAYRMGVEWNLEGEIPYCAGTLAVVNLLRGRPESTQALATEALEICRRTGDKVAGTDAVLLLALSASQIGSSEQAALLHGAFDACLTGVSVAVPFIAPADARRRQEDHDRLRDQLGERFDMALSRGNATLLTRRSQGLSAS
jgi:predicted ATPase